MIKIEFKEAQTMKGQRSIAMFDFEHDDLFSDHSMYKVFWKDSFELRAILPYTPTQDPMLDRSEILKQLGISQQEDELFQEQYKNV